jgi:hypothetical protein
MPDTPLNYPPQVHKKGIPASQTGKRGVFSQAARGLE